SEHCCACAGPDIRRSEMDFFTGVPAPPLRVGGLARWVGYRLRHCDSLTESAAGNIKRTGIKVVEAVCDSSITPLILLWHRQRACSLCVAHGRRFSQGLG